jgi:Flp pilus assembly protein TadD
MTWTDAEFDDLREVGREPAGAVLEGRREGGTWLLRPLAGTFRLRPEQERLARPLHAALVPVELVRVGGRPYVAGAVRGTPLATLARQADGPVFPAAACLTVGRELADALAAAGTGSVGHLSWHDVRLDPEQPGKVWLFPRLSVPARTTDWLALPVEDLAFADRDSLRQAGSDARREVFALGAVLLVLSTGPGAVAAARRSTPAEFVRQAVLDGHPLERAPLPPGALGDLIGRLLAAGSGAFGDAAELAGCIDEQRGAADPIHRACGLARAGELIEAEAILHRAAQAGPTSWALLALKGTIERTRGATTRARRSFGSAKVLAPEAPEVLSALVELAGSPDEAAAALREAIAADPFDPRLRVEQARQLWRAHDPESALHALELARQLAVGEPSAARVALDAGLALVEFGLLPLAARFVEDLAAPEAPAEVRADALAILGRAHYELAGALTGHGRSAEAAGERARAAEALDEAARLYAQQRPDGVPLEVWKLLAYSLAAVGREDEARSVAERCLAQHPDESDLRRFIARLRGRRF